MEKLKIVLMGCLTFSLIWSGSWVAIVGCSLVMELQEANRQLDRANTQAAEIRLEVQQQNKLIQDISKKISLTD